MFKCEKCKKVSKSKEKAYKKVIQTRPKEYTNDNGVVIGKGYEAVKEITVCQTCMEVR